MDARSRLLPTEFRDPATGLPTLAALDNPTAVSLVLGHLALLAGDPNQPDAWSALAGADPSSRRLVWARFGAVDGCVAGAVDVFWDRFKPAASAVATADALLVLALCEAP